MMEKFQVFILFMEEILHQLIGSLSRYFQGFMHSQVVCQISEPSTVRMFDEFLAKKDDKTHGIFGPLGCSIGATKKASKKLLLVPWHRREGQWEVKVVLD